MVKIPTTVIAQCVAALQSGNVAKALAIKNQYYNQASATFDDSSSEVIENTLKHTPTLLSDCPPEMCEPLRIAAALMELWGSNNIREFVTIEGAFDYRFGPDAVAHMLLGHGNFLYRLNDFRRVGIKFVELLNARDPDECEVCRNAEGITYTLDAVPELPLRNCTCEDRYGCRVTVITVQEPTKR